jgi:hypothetical protein
LITKVFVWLKSRDKEVQSRKKFFDILVISKFCCHLPPTGAATTAAASRLSGSIGINGGGPWSHKEVGANALWIWMAPGPGPPGALKRPWRFALEIHFVWGFRMGAQGA